MSTTDELRAGLSAFAVYARSLKGDEKGEAQLFLDKFFRALGHAGVKEAGATLEFRIAKRPGSAGCIPAREKCRSGIGYAMGTCRTGEAPLTTNGIIQRTM